MVMMPQIGAGARVIKYIAVVVEKDGKHILYFVDQSTGKYKEILKHNRKIKDIVFNTVLTKDNLQFAMIEEEKYTYNILLFNYSNTRDVLQRLTPEEKKLPSKIENWAVTFSSDGNSLIYGNSPPDETHHILIHSLVNTKKKDRMIEMENFVCKIKVFQEYIFVESGYLISIYKNEEKYYDVFLDVLNPIFDKKDKELDYNDRSCELTVVNQFYTKDNPDIPTLCMAVLTSPSHSFNCIHLYDVVKKRKIDQFKLDNELLIKHMELYSNGKHLIFNTNTGIYAINTVLGGIIGIIEGDFSHFTIDGTAMFCYNQTTKSLEKINLDLSRLEQEDNLKEITNRILELEVEVEQLDIKKLDSTLLKKKIKKLIKKYSDLEKLNSKIEIRSKEKRSVDSEIKSKIRLLGDLRDGRAIVAEELKQDQSDRVASLNLLTEPAEVTELPTKPPVSETSSLKPVSATSVSKSVATKSPLVASLKPVSVPSASKSVTTKSPSSVASLNLLTEPAVAIELPTKPPVTATSASKLPVLESSLKSTPVSVASSALKSVAATSATSSGSKSSSLELSTESVTGFAKKTSALSVLSSKAPLVERSILEEDRSQIFEPDNINIEEVKKYRRMVIDMQKYSNTIKNKILGMRKNIKFQFQKVYLYDFANVTHNQPPGLKYQEKITNYMEERPERNDRTIYKLFVTPNIRSKYDNQTHRINTISEDHNLHYITISSNLDVDVAGKREIDDVFLLLLANHLISNKIDVKMVSADKYGPKHYNNICEDNFPCNSDTLTSIRSVFKTETLPILDENGSVMNHKLLGGYLNNWFHHCY